MPNHTSDEHMWFQQALAAGPGSPERARYLFREGRGEDGSQPPNNWESVFGGPAWTRVADGQWYLHLFDTTQPDLDWRNPEVPAMFEDVLRFWLDRGVDGFRVDVAHGLFKEASLRDQQVVPHAGHSGSMVERRLHDEPMWDQPEVHDVYRQWHRVLAAYDGDRMAVAEAWTQTAESMARFVRPDELSQTFNFGWLLAEWSATAFADVIHGTLTAMEPVGAAPTWVLSNHDVVRHPSRYGGGERGLARARAATLTMLALPGPPTSTRARSWASRRSTSHPPTGRTRRRCGPASAVATVAACRSRGRARPLRTASARAGRRPGSRSRTPGAS